MNNNQNGPDHDHDHDNDNDKDNENDNDKDHHDDSDNHNGIDHVIHRIIQNCEINSVAPAAHARARGAWALPPAARVLPHSVNPWDIESISHWVSEPLNV